MNTICSRCQLPTEADDLVDGVCAECDPVVRWGAEWHGPMTPILNVTDREAAEVLAVVDDNSSSFASLVSGLASASWDDPPSQLPIPVADMRRVTVEMDRGMSIGPNGEERSMTLLDALEADIVLNGTIGAQDRAKAVARRHIAGELGLTLTSLDATS